MLIALVFMSQHGHGIPAEWNVSRGQGPLLLGFPHSFKSYVGDGTLSHACCITIMCPLKQEGAVAEQLYRSNAWKQSAILFMSGNKVSVLM